MYLLRLLDDVFDVDVCEVVVGVVMVIIPKWGVVNEEKIDDEK